MSYLIDICKVGNKGEQSVDTCQFLNRTKQGYFCKKLTLKSLQIYNNYTNSLLGDNCIGLPENNNLKLG